MNFSINMDGDLAAKANKDADALEKLQNALRAEEKALAAMQKQMTAIQRASVVDIGVHKKLSAGIQASKDKIAAMTNQVVQYGPGILAASKAQVELAKSGEEVGEALEKSRGDIVSFDAAVNLMARGLKLVKGLFSALREAMSFSEARLDAENILTTVFDSEKAAEHTYDVITAVTKRVAISQDKAIEVADSLSKAGVYSGDALVRAVESVGKAEAARKGAGQVIQGIIERSEKARQAGFGNMGGFTVNRQELRSAGIQYKDFLETLSKQTGRSMQDVAGALRVGRVSVAAGLDALNATVDRKLGPLAEKKFYTIGAAMTRVRDTLGRLFDSMDTSVVARALDGFTRFFDDSTVSGMALKAILGSIFDGISAGIDRVMPYVTTVFDFLLNVFLRVRHALKPVREVFAEVFGSGGADVLTFEKTLRGVADVLVPLVTGFVGGWLLIQGTLQLVVGAIADVIGWAFRAIEAFKTGGWEALGTYIVDGLTKGLADGATKFVESMGKLATAGLKTFKNIFGIASPSKVMMAQGSYIDQGLAKGITAGSGEPTRAMDDMSQQTMGATPMAQASGGGGGKSGPSISVTFADGAIQIHGVAGMADIKEQLPPLMADLFEQLGLSMGAEQPA